MSVSKVKGLFRKRLLTQKKNSDEKSCTDKVEGKFSAK